MNITQKSHICKTGIVSSIKLKKVEPIGILSVYAESSPYLNPIQGRASKQ